VAAQQKLRPRHGQRYGWDIGLNGEVFANEVKGDPTQPWRLAFWFGGWDCDALCAYVKGTLEVPQ
jgi:hypothetical protein